MGGERKPLNEAHDDDRNADAQDDRRYDVKRSDQAPGILLRRHPHPKFLHEGGLEGFCFCEVLVHFFSSILWSPLIGGAEAPYNNATSRGIRRITPGWSRGIASRGVHDQRRS